MRFNPQPDTIVITRTGARLRIADKAAVMELAVEHLVLPPVKNRGT